MSTTIKQLKQKCLHFWQRRTRGFDDAVTWNLDSELAKWLLPRLKLFKEKTNGVPGELCIVDGTEIPIEEAEKNWDAILDKIIYSLEQLIEEDLLFTDDIEEWNEYQQKIQEGCDLLGKHLRGLWW